MSSRAKGGWGAYEFTRPAYEIQRAAEIQHSVWIEVKLTTTFQKGVYRVVVASQPILEQDYHLKHSVSEDFPGTRVQAFEAVLFALLGKISIMLDHAAADVARQEAKRQSRW